MKYPTIKRTVRDAFKYLGVTAFLSETMPRGIDLEVDLTRAKVIPPSGTIFDVGANEGQTALAFRRMFPSARVLSFEPVGKTFDRLNVNVEGKRVQTYRLALGDEKKQATIFHQEYSLLNSLRPSNNVPKNSLRASEQVEVTTVDLFCREQKIEAIDLLKTDTEGYDLEVLAGAGEMFGRRAVSAVYSEVNFIRNGKQSDFFAVHDFLDSRQFTLFGLYEMSDWKFGIRKNGYCNALFIRNDLLPGGGPADSLSLGER